MTTRGRCLGFHLSDPSRPLPFPLDTSAPVLRCVLSRWRGSNSLLGITLGRGGMARMRCASAVMRSKNPRLALRADLTAGYRSHYLAAWLPLLPRDLLRCDFARPASGL